VNHSITLCLAGQQLGRNSFGLTLTLYFALLTKILDAADQFTGVKMSLKWRRQDQFQTKKPNGKFEYI
jgi:hypothetical protein